MMHKIFLVIWLIFAGTLSLGYARYVHDDEENVLGAVSIFVLVLLTAGAVYLA